MNKQQLMACAGVSLMLTCGAMVPTPVNAGTLTVSANLRAGTCELTPVGNGKITFAPHTAQDFVAGNGTAEVQSFAIQVSNCSVPLSTHIGWNTRIRVRAGGGTTTGTNSNGHVFTDNANSTTGFMLRELDNQSPSWTGDIRSFYDPSASVGNGEYTHQESGSVITDGSALNYAVGFVQVAPQTPAEPETVKATLTFTFEYA
ncbi:fimbrial protein [Enterobacter asburiae]|uniref:fimbrial protein n=1 Tax=Enterobacter asburiae TaxID=61645 RepID=UPI003F55ACE1